ncbi:2-hydroxyacid dehydrogenase [Celerinatantimonas yamalensis]|uniref:D-glycerate dehydrogenase n=1 Tax=Celerinatantimonas yamalensis TaxID=559956 RepID=A0ABW9GAB6_9GAMM
MKPSLIVLVALNDSQRQRLDALFEVHSGKQLCDIPSEQLSVAQGLLAHGGLTLGEEQLAQLPQLKAISTISVGYDSYDIEALSRAGVTLSHTPGVLDETVADSVFALMLSCARRIVELADWVRDGQWQGSLPKSYYGCDVHHKTIGIVGMGRIGMAVARRAHYGFGMSVLYHNRHSKPMAEQQFAARLVDLDELLQTADFVVLLTPLTTQTFHLIAAAQLAMMKPSAILVNVARGDVIDEAALIEALQQKTIAGAGLDVFHQEPLANDSALLKLPQVVALPHIGSATTQTRAAMSELAVTNMIEALTLRQLNHCVNPHAWHR